jgi:LacI family transcriptional regulator
MVPMSRAQVRIGLVLDYSLGYCRAVIQGIKSFAEERPNWLLTLVRPEPTALQRLEALRPDGLIAYVFSSALGERLVRLDRPLINISAIVPDLKCPRVVVDDQLLGRMAAAHLLDRGLLHFAFVGHAQLGYSILREEGFRAVLGDAGFAPLVFRGRGLSPRDTQDLLWSLNERVEKWLAALPKPIGVFVPNDIWCYQLLEICRQIGLRVPEDVAMIGVEIDGLLCELARPPLTSIAIPAERIGKEAAGLLDRLLADSRPLPSTLLVPPLGVVTRQSTDVLAIDDPEVAAAVRFIREHGLARIRVRDVLQAVPVPRRTLERRFRLALNRGIGEEIRRARIERARFLLASADHSMSEIAQRSGFSNAEQLSTAFHRETGLTPTAYRRQSRDAFTWPLMG